MMVGRAVKAAFFSEDVYGVAASCVWGIKKLQFNSIDYSVLTVESYSPGA